MTELNVVHLAEQPPTRTYEVRTGYGDIYRADGDRFEDTRGWLTVWAADVAVLQVGSRYVRVIRQVGEGELVATAEPELLDPKLAALVFETLGIELASGEWSLDEVLHNACRELRKSEEARRHLRSERDRLKAALERVRSLPTEPEAMNSEQEHPDIWRHGYACGVRAARAAAVPRDEEASS